MCSLSTLSPIFKGGITYYLLSAFSKTQASSETGSYLKEKLALMSTFFSVVHNYRIGINIVDELASLASESYFFKQHILINIFSRK